MREKEFQESLDYYQRAEKQQQLVLAGLGLSTLSEVQQRFTELTNQETELKHDIDYYQRAENKQQTILAAMGVASLAELKERFHALEQAVRRVSAMSTRSYAKSAGDSPFITPQKTAPGLAENVANSSWDRSARHPDEPQYGNESRRRRQDGHSERVDQRRGEISIAGYSPDLSADLDPKVARSFEANPSSHTPGDDSAVWHDTISPPPRTTRPSTSSTRSQHTKSSPSTRRMPPAVATTRTQILRRQLHRKQQTVSTEHSGGANKAGGGTKHRRQRTNKQADGGKKSGGKRKPSHRKSKGRTPGPPRGASSTSTAANSPFAKKVCYIFWVCRYWIM